jgi:hypothetical protein
MLAIEKKFISDIYQNSKYMKHLKLFDAFCEISEDLQYHVDNNKPVVENIFRPGTDKYFELIKEARRLFDSNKIELSELDNELFESTDIGMFSIYNGVSVPLDLPLESDNIDEAEYKGREVELNKPMRSSKKVSSKKYHVFVKDPKSGKVRMIAFGDVHGGLTAKVSDPAARKSFAARHQCKTKKDRMTAGYWACRINKYGHLWGGKTYPGYW